MRRGRCYRGRMSGDEPREAMTVGQFLEAQAAYEVDPVKGMVADRAIEVLLAFMTSTIRILGYQRITIDALDEYRRRGITDLDLGSDDGISPEDLTKLIALVVRNTDVQFLEKESADAEAHVVGQSVLSMWSALEVFAGDLVLGVLANDRSPLATVHTKHKVSVAEFFAMDDENRVARVVELVRADAKLSPGIGAFEPMFDAFGLGKGADETTRRVLLEFAAVRNCLAHRKGIVDERFLEACGTTKLKVGDALRLTQDHAACYFYAANQYASAVADRVTAKYMPGRDPLPLTAQMLENLNAAVAKLGARSL